jgi:hypothetical protein
MSCINTNSAMTGARFVEDLNSDDESHTTSSVPSDEESASSASTLSHDIYDEQLYNILKSFLVTSSGKRVADVLQDSLQNIVKELAGLRLAVTAMAPTTVRVTKE